MGASSDGSALRRYNPSALPDRALPLEQPFTELYTLFMSDISLALKERLPPESGFAVTPDEVDAFVSDVEGRANIGVRRYPQFAGRSAFAITVGDPGRAELRLFVSRPHAHEPAGTAACCEFVRQLSAPAPETAAWAKRLLEQFAITFVPDANPSGSLRAPVRFWDGGSYTNEEFFLWMFGEAGESPGRRFPRLADWDARKVTPPRKLGIAYEQIDAHTYVEPNRDYRSTFFKSFFDLDETVQYQVWLDLHQTEFENSDRNCAAHLPIGIDDLSGDLPDLHRDLGARLHARWSREGARPRGKPDEPYRDDPVQHKFLSRVWRPVCSRMVHLVTEVQNNSSATPVRDQVWLQMAAVLETLAWMEANRGGQLGAEERITASLPFPLIDTGAK